MSSERAQLRRLATEVRTGATTATELVDRALDRMAAATGLGAVVAVRADEARSEAAEVDAAAASGVPLGPLAGLPVLVKDCHDVAGMTTTHASLLFEDAAPATGDALIVSRLREAGAICVGKANLPEFCIEGFTDNLLFGPARNPWNPELSPGGSSGGSAAALAAGLVPIATGTDGGGSVRIPAGLCGIVGYKPTNGVIGRSPAPDWIDFSTDGFMATAVDDLRVLVEVLAGPVAGDPTALPVPLPAGAAPARLLVAERTDDLGPLPPEVATAFARASAKLADLLGVPVEQHRPEDFFPGRSADNDWFTLAAPEHLSALGRSFVEENLDRMHPNTADIFRAGLAVDAAGYLDARRRRFDYIARMDTLLGRDRYLVTPTLAVGGITADGRLGGTGGLLPPEAYSTAVQNMVGLPAVSLPAGTLPDGMPFGLQVTAPRWADLALLDLAERWERAEPWPLTAPGYQPFG